MLYARAITQAPFGQAVFVSAFFLLVVLLAPFPVAAAEVVGKVILSIGQNQAAGPDGQVRKLARKAEVYADDLLTTGKKGRLQVRFTDGSRLSLRSETEFKIAEYRFDAAEPTEGKAIYKLLKGGMRTLSGQIGKVDKEDYRLETTVATIGIRGTDFVIISKGTTVTGSVNSGEINVAGNEGARSENIVAGNSFVIQTQGAIQVFETPPSTETGEGSAEDGSSEEDTEESEESSESDESEASDDSEGTGDSDTAAESEGTAGEETAAGETTQEGADTTADAGTGDASAGGSSVSDDTGSVTLNIDAADVSGSDATLPATDPQLTTPPSDTVTESTEGRIPQAPNPTGNAVLAPEGSLVAVAFNSNESGSLKNANDAVKIEKRSAAMIDSKMVTGIRFVHSDSLSADACSPCLFTGSDSLSDVKDSGFISVGSSNVSWGRWDSGFEVVSNGVTLETSGSFSFMYTDSLTTAAEVAAVAGAKSGSYLYTFGQGSSLMTPPQIETGQTGTLIGYGDTSVAKESQLYNGTYMVIDWDTQTITETSVVAQVNDGTGVRTYSLIDSADTSLSSVLDGGEIGLSGTCYGGACTVVETETNMSGQMTVNLVGSQAEGAITSYGATGVMPDGTPATVSGTALLQDGGLAP